MVPNVIACVNLCIYTSSGLATRFCFGKWIYFRVRYTPFCGLIRNVFHLLVVWLLRYSTHCKMYEQKFPMLMTLCVLKQRWWRHVWEGTLAPPDVPPPPPLFYTTNTLRGPCCPILFDQPTLNYLISAFMFWTGSCTCTTLSNCDIYI